MYALLAEKLWEADELRRIGGSGTSSSGRATGDEVAESANDGRRRGTAAGQPVRGFRPPSRQSAQRNPTACPRLSPGPQPSGSQPRLNSWEVGMPCPCRAGSSSMLG